MVLSDATQAVAGKTIAESTNIKQWHTDGISHKGTEIVNIFSSILNKDKKFKNICLAVDIIPEDGTAASQSAFKKNKF